MEEFFGAFEAECREHGQSISAVEMMLRIGECGPRPVMLEAIGRIRRRGIAVAALTNNWVGEQDRTHELRGHFDAFVESSAVGLRKPDRRIYLLACKSLGIEPAEAVFLDDIGRNLKIARELGMTTLKVDEPEQALDALSSLLGFALR
jgi:epoxide hydrolase-like predicted phosphatase